ncbi:MAG TPA: arylamine N-acetyltransferase [Acidimicrobiales bacterium]|nr:arylamine N-acetyltransferase [Acidimicrobiales bacterium]
MPPLRSLPAYLDRIGLAGSPAPGLAEIHRAHATTIPFENFDPHAGIPVSLDLGHLEDKMVTRGRGGYCFEHNLLLGAALDSLDGFEVAPMLARVRLGPEGSPRPLNHLLLRVSDRDGTWLADVGFGGGGLLDPLPFAAGPETGQSGWRYRLVEQGPELVLQVFQDDAWTDMYGFVPEPAEAIDIAVNNWYTATHPESDFVKGIIVGRRFAERCLSLFVFEQAVVVERPVGGASAVAEVARTDVPALLAERFGVRGVVVRDDGDLALDERPREGS